MEAANETDRDVLLRLRGKPERGRRDVDDDAIGVGQRENAIFNLFGEADQETGMQHVAAERRGRGSSDSSVSTFDRSADV